MMRARFLRSRDTNPYRNLAREETLLQTIRGEAILYLWQNASTVVIGRNQNAWRECAVALLEREGGTLARRTTGGGAVFHDLGNLNFSFILPRGAYDLPRQLSVIQAALTSLGIACAFSGRNDLLASGRKFSGNAFRFTREGALHHGTLMVDVDLTAMARYLQVSKEKLQARGVKSVPSRVVNLREVGDVTVESLAGALQRAHGAEYGGEGGRALPEEDADALCLPGYAELAERNALWEWNYGAAPAFDAAFEKRFEWGSVQLLLTLSQGAVAQCQVFTDAMDADLAERLSSALAGCPFDARAMAERAKGEIGEWLGGLRI